MSITLNWEAYQELLYEDLTYLLEQPRTLERDHIEQILRYMLDNRELKHWMDRRQRMLEERRSDL